VNLIFSHQNIRALSATLSNVAAVTGELRDHKEIIANAQSTLQHADAAVQQFEILAKSSNVLVSKDAKESLGKLNGALDEVSGATHDLRTLVDGLKGPTQSFAETGLPQLTSALRSLQMATDHLDRVLNDVESNPRGLIGKAPPKEVEVRP
jgi:phospholipid/cholesterol/gamma-HCH transport system substrate-binding protein